MAYFVIGLVSVLIAGGQVLLKQALSSTKLVETKLVPLAGELFFAFLHPKPLFAFMLCGLGSVLYFAAMRFIDISQLVPMTAGMIVVFAAFMGWAFFQEDMQPHKIIAILMIVGGVVVVGRA